MEGQIVQYDDELNGVLITERGVQVSIPGALLGEKVRYHIEHSSPHAPKAWGRCDALLVPSPNRVRPVCPIAWPTVGQCAGCPLMHILAQTQNQLKQQITLDALSKAGINYIRTVPFHPASQTLNYRNRTDLVAAQWNQKFCLGAYKNRSHDIVPIQFCHILRQPLNSVLRFIVKAANQHRIPAYRNELQSQGSIRYISLFANDQREVLVDIVCTSAQEHTPSWLNPFAHRLKDFSSICGVSYSINDSPNNAIRTEAAYTLWGKERLPEHHGNIISLFSASGFTQLNSQMAAEIYAAARDWLPSRPHVVWDLYCGAGAFGRTLHPSKKLYGAEFNAPAIEAARQTSKGDPFETHFEVINLETNWPDWPLPDVLLLDPPRKGLSKLAIEKIKQTLFPTILYMSCNPASFASNVAELNDHYVLQRIEAFDMMPQTRHVEVLGMLCRR